MVIFIADNRSDSIDNSRKEIVRGWTNEGDVTSPESTFIDLKLENNDGDIVGTLQSPQLDHPLDVQASIGWCSTLLVISEVRGRSIVEVGRAEVKITGNKNRMQWRLTGARTPDYLPRETTLWPVTTALPQ